MADNDIEGIRQLLANCNEAERKAIFDELRAQFQIHELESIFNASAEVILEAIHRASDLTKWMLRGVIADAAFAKYVVPALAPRWRDDMPPGNHAFDHKVADGVGAVTIQVKLQRSKLATGPIVTTGRSYGGLAPGMFMAELQRTRTGTREEGDGDATKTRPYRYGEFDILAVSLQPSTGDWSRFRYTVGNWLLPSATANEIATYQPVSRTANEDWTDDFDTAVDWLRSGVAKRINNAGGTPSTRRARRGG